jgi:DNA-binding transcriptional regulator YiaG
LSNICGNWKTNGSTREEYIMPKTLDEALAALPQEQQDGVERRARDLIRRISLRELRKSLGLSQKQLAEALKVSQAPITLWVIAWSKIQDKAVDLRAARSKIEQ